MLKFIYREVLKALGLTVFGITVKNTEGKSTAKKKKRSAIGRARNNFTNHQFKIGREGGWGGRCVEDSTKSAL